MKRTSVLVSAICAGILLSTVSLNAHEYDQNPFNLSASAAVSTKKTAAKATSTKDQTKPVVYKLGAKGDKVEDIQRLLNKFNHKLTVDGHFGTKTKNAVMDFQKRAKILVDGEVGPATFAKLKTKPIASLMYKAPVLSRGGKPPVDTETSASNPVSGKVETLDWWKQARNVFSTGSVATVKDVYTGKTFKIKRTMGANHADCEALTAEDTKVIKSVWGGFTWTTRPVHITVKGRTLAASMSSLPHAGVDSAPAFAVVNNRSEGYGRGENLDVIKNNGMNGHFDVHFLNSTRHKDGKVDPRHQSSIRIASAR
jgi:peptidoglycan hydrolase-like protein with peptidoglycan-binding domain